MTLKGQNFRIFVPDEIYGGLGSESVPVALATNCTVTLTGNTEEAGTKDDVGGAQKPEITSKSWQVQVDSLNVTDAAAMLTTVKSMQPLVLVWDETSTVDNQTPRTATFARMGAAYLNDLTLTFNDRENSAKNCQFTGSGPLQTVSGRSFVTPTSSSYTKGQFVRLFLSSDNSATPSKVIAAAKTLNFHVSLALEDSTTKDTEGDWVTQEPTGLSYDISTNALVRSGDVITSSVAAQDLSSIESIYEASAPVKFQIANVSGANQRTKGSVIVSGSVLLTQLSISAQNRQNATYDAQLTGYGEYVVGA